MSRRRFLCWAAFGGVAGVAVDGFAVEPEWIKLRRLPHSIAGSRARFVHFTDLHHKGDESYLRAVVDRINALEPNFVCFTGDIVEEPAHLASALEGLKRIKAPLYGVPGNHDYWSGIDFRVVDAAFRATGGRWLMDEAVMPDGAGVNVVGSSCHGEARVEPVSGTRNILLVHYPSWADHLAPGPFDLILAGHSHGGQVRLPMLGALMVPYGVGEYELGWYRAAAGPLYVNSGIGFFFVDVRFNCRPEITFFEPGSREPGSP